MSDTANVMSRTEIMLRSVRPRAAQWIASAPYGQKWLVLGSVIGVIAGLGAVVFYEALVISTHFFLGVLAGYQIPEPISEGAKFGSTHFARAWAIPLVACVGALAAGMLVYGIAPDAEGHGTDAAISAVHNNPRGIRMRTVAVKIVASALTIGSGGSGGREGPTGQISAGFGSFLARLLDLSPSDARIAVASGVGSGIGSIFGAPLGGTVLAAEIMYRDDFEIEALLPSFIASVAGYIVFGSIEGFGPLFGYAHNFHLTSVSELVWFALIGVLGGLVGLLYSATFYGIVALFHRMPVPRWLRPAIGGLIVGLIALAIPEVLGTGYGWIQKGLGPQLAHIPLWIVLVLPFARIVATGLSIGSGGSGGIFGPGMVIGAFIGAAVWRLFDPMFPSLGHSPAPFVIVGMMACFGGISRAPLAVMLMVAEMTGSLTLILPAMVAVGLATLIVHRTDDSIYRSQPKNRAESPAHRILAGLPLLAAVHASDAMVSPRLVLAGDVLAEDAYRTLKEAGLDGAPVVDDQRRYLGAFIVHRRHDNESEALARPERSAAESIDPTFVSVSCDATLAAVLDVVTSSTQTWTAVIDDDRRVTGVLAISDIVRGYRRGLLTSLRRMSDVGGPAGATEFTIDPASELVGATLRSSVVPHGVLVTSIERGREVVQPVGDTVLRAGDRLSVLGATDELRRLASTS